MQIESEIFDRAVMEDCTNRKKKIREAEAISREREQPDKMLEQALKEIE